MIQPTAVKLTYTKYNSLTGDMYLGMKAIPCIAYSYLFSLLHPHSISTFSSTFKMIF